MSNETKEGGSGIAASLQPDVQAPVVTFESLTFSDGSKITLEPTDVVVFVGPNNAGKSVALRELEEHIGSSHERTVVKSVTLRRSGSEEEIVSYLEEHTQKKGLPENQTYRGYNFSVAVRNTRAFWKNNLSAFRSLFCMRLSTEKRLTDGNPPSAIPFLDESASHPIHLMYLDNKIADKISGYFRNAFGEDLIVFRLGGSKIPLLVGVRPQPETGEDATSPSYNERLVATTVPLEKQGDGMRSFASVILHLLAPKHPSVLLLDEPEAYLHPPQARILGEIIARERSSRAQLFVATHSTDVLQGLLSVAPEHLHVLRMERKGNINHVKELEKRRAKEISADPLMKYSNVLSGVFHRRVIISESEADCMFYSALLDLPEVHGKQRPDVLFVHANGKHRMAALAEAMADLDVRTDVVADIDILREEPLLQRIVEALGGGWAAVKAKADPLRKAIEQHKPWLNANEVKKGVQSMLEKTPESGKFPKELREEINSIFRKASPWDAIKDAGEHAIPAGDPQKLYKDLQTMCKQMGLWIVPVGELEGFCKLVGGHGPRWVQQVIENHDLSKSTELERARKFVSELWNGPRSECEEAAKTA